MTEQTTTTDTASLGLGSVLISSLPATLLTEQAPERYTVEAVFTRKPDREELVGISDPATALHLAEHGYPDVTVRVSDRRLAIVNTTLEELRDGLADTIAQRLSDISTDARDRRTTEASRLKRSADAEHLRAAAVVELAQAVTFTAGGGATNGTSAP